MDYRGHVGMDQAYELEVADGRENHSVGLSVRRRAAVHARGAVERGAIRGSSWTPHHERKTNLPGSQKAYGVNLVGDKVPGNAVASENPHLIGQKGQGLPSLVKALGAYRSLPRLSLYYCWNDQGCQ